MIKKILSILFINIIYAFGLILMLSLLFIIKEDLYSYVRLKNINDYEISPQKNQKDIKNNNPPIHMKYSEDKETFNSQSMWENDHLSLIGPIDQYIDYQFASYLASISDKNGTALGKQGYCLRSVKRNLFLTNTFFSQITIHPDGYNVLSVDRGKKKHHYLPGRSAEDFRKWSLENPLSLCENFRLKKFTNITYNQLQKGFILVYKKNECGHHSRYGHIEVIANLNPLIACSDHCRKIKKRCLPKLVLVPVKNCYPIYEANI